MAAHRSLLLLLPLLASLLLRNVAAITLSSRLIHHFSDEPKALKASRSTGDAKWLGRWPRRNSMDYYHLLVNTDFQRQKMKLAAAASPRHHQFQFLFPSEGSHTASFGNYFGLLHYMWIDIGTPNVSFLPQCGFQVCPLHVRGKSPMNFGFAIALIFRWTFWAFVVACAGVAAGVELEEECIVVIWIGLGIGIGIVAPVAAFVGFFFF